MPDPQPVRPSQARIYVAGPMSGLPDYNLPAFAAASEALRGVGFDPVNPGRRGVMDGWEYADYLRVGFADLLTCGGVALLPGWQDSKGVRHELALADALDLSWAPLDYWLHFGPVRG